MHDNITNIYSSRSLHNVWGNSKWWLYIVCICTPLWYTDFKEDFTENLLLNLPFSDRLDHTNPLIRNILRFLADNFEIEDIDNDDFDVRNFIESLLDAVVDSTARNFGQTVSTVQCITRVIRSLVNRNAVGAITSQLQQIRRAITALMEISRFLEQQRDRLQNAQLLEECVATLVNIAFCSRCTRKTPPMCFSTCNALLRGCYSPYYTALNGQYLPLWTEVRRIVELANDTVEDILSGEGALLDTSNVVSIIISEVQTILIICGWVIDLLWLANSPHTSYITL